jgi:hypothetical protein
VRCSHRVDRGTVIAKARYRPVAVGTIAAISAFAVITRFPAAAAESLPSSSFATSVTMNGSIYAAIPMGDLGQSLNTFWQLFELSGGSTGWKLLTPPGIADNGGLVIEGGSPSALTVAIRPSNLLTFTPIALKANHTSWSDGGLIPAALVGAPTAYVGTNVASFAAVKNGGGAVLRSTNGTAWNKIGSSASLSSVAGGSCRLAGVQALATNRGLPLYAGGTCVAGDRAGIFEFSGSWRDIGPKLGSLADRSSRVVLELSATESGLEALIATSSGATTRLILAFSSTNGASWVTSDSLRIPSSADIVSSGGLGSSGAYVVWQKSGTMAAVAGANGRWTSLPRLPDHALTLAFPQGPSGRIDALGGHHSEFLAWQLDSSRSRWRQTEAFAVPIVYGSS